MTASRHLSSQLDEGEAGDAGSGAGSGASTPGRPSSPSGGRVLRPPWALQGARRVHVGVDAAGVPGEQPLRLHLTSLEQLGEGGGQLAALGGSPLAEELGALHISEEEALQRALELSLQDARQQQGAAEAGGAPAAGGDGDGAPPEQQPQAATAAAAAGAPLQHAARTE